MSKRIIICCDGTWNKPQKRGKNGSETNVVKIHDAVNIEGENKFKQLPYYDKGIGADGTWIKRVYQGATGSGISENILEAYQFLIDNYEPDDKLFFFGFSRGAFTVRSLAGLIRNSGILRKDAESMKNRAYELYKSRDLSTHPDAIQPVLFRKAFAVQDIVPIRFIGVWDTVGSLGNPLFINNIFSKLSISVMMNSFHDTDLSSTIDYAYQALAVDEKRRNFKPTVWRRQEKSTAQVLEQVWFVGSHSNIGGGCGTTGLSNITLKWMADKAKALGLELDDIPMPIDETEKPENSWKGFYRLICKYYRPVGRIKNGNESLDGSVTRRLADDAEYRPKNLKYFYPEAT